MSNTKSTFDRMLHLYQIPSDVKFQPHQTAHRVVTGERVPHRRHWATLAELVGIFSS
jgi:hypothetical protein